jgi:redox-sensing transcriptional repressor
VIDVGDYAKVANEPVFCHWKTILLLGENRKWHIIIMPPARVESIGGRLAQYHKRIRENKIPRNFSLITIDKSWAFCYSSCEIFHKGVISLAAGVSEAAKGRLLQLMQALEKHCGGKGPVTSAQAEQLTGWPRDTIRKDISVMSGAEGAAIGGNAGYEPGLLIPMIKKALGLERPRKFCVVGLGRLGSAFLNFAPAELKEFELAAGFDTNVNRVEIIRAEAPLYPAYKMAEVISRFGIEIALLCVPAEAAQAAAEKCAAGGVRGILNFAPLALSLPPDVTVRNVYLADELRSLAIKMKEKRLL